MRRPAKAILKTAVTAALLAFLYRRLDIAALRESLSSIRWGIVPVFFLIAVFNMWISSLRWNLLLRADGIRIPVQKLFASHWIASFFNFFLPSNVGGDVYRVADVGRKSGTAVGSLASVFMDRLVGFVAMSFLGFVFPLVGYKLIPPEHRIKLLVPLVVFAGFICLSALIWQRKFLQACVHILPHRIRGGVNSILAKFFSSIDAYAKRPSVLAKAFLLSLLFQFLVFVAVFVVGTALRIEARFEHYLVFVPFVCILEAIPVSINGLGLRDFGYKTFFAAVGIADSITAAGSMSICYMGFTLIYALGGGALFLMRSFLPNSTADKEVANDGANV